MDRAGAGLQMQKAIGGGVLQEAHPHLLQVVQQRGLARLAAPDHGHRLGAFRADPGEDPPHQSLLSEKILRCFDRCFGIDHGPAPLEGIEEIDA
jgi:hypothetical protein